MTCPCCFEDLFHSVKSSISNPCGHWIHQECLENMLAANRYQCPVCRKSMVEMDWDTLALEIALQPMPPELECVKTIICNDCEEISENIPFHYLGMRCVHCGSFNTHEQDSQNGIWYSNVGSLTRETFNHRLITWNGVITDLKIYGCCNGNFKITLMDTLKHKAFTWSFRRQGFIQFRRTVWF